MFWCYSQQVDKSRSFHTVAESLYGQMQRFAIDQDNRGK